MFKISYSPNLHGEITVPASKNAALPIVAANYCVDNSITLTNKPDIIDIHNMEKLADHSLSVSEDYFDLSDELASKFRASILLIPLGLQKFGKVKFVSPGGCKIGKRPLDMFDNGLQQAGIDIYFDEQGYKRFQKKSNPKKNIMMQEFSVTAIEALITYLAFLPDINYQITIRQCATEPHIKNLISFLNNAGAQIEMGIDHTITITPQPKFSILNSQFLIVTDYIQAGTYFAIGAGADDSEITLKNFPVDDLSAMYSMSTKMGIDFKILDKQTVKVSSKNKKNYKSPTGRLETRIFPGFPTDLQSIFGTLLTQCNGISKIFETMFEGRFSYLNELENLGAKVEILNPHQALVIGPTKLKGNYVSSADLRAGAAMVLAGIMAEGETFVMQEDIILRGYENIIENLRSIGVKIERVQ